MRWRNRDGFPEKVWALEVTQAGFNSGTKKNGVLLIFPRKPVNYANSLGDESTLCGGAPAQACLPGRKSPKSWNRGLWLPKTNPLHFQDWGIFCGRARSNTCIQAQDSGRTQCSQEVMLDVNSYPFSVPPNLVLSGEWARLRLNKPSASVIVHPPSCRTPLAES